MTYHASRSRGVRCPEGLRIPRPVGVVATLLLVVSCSPGGERSPERATVDSAALAEADALLAEVAGGQFTELSMRQRWRAVASLGTGLPPTDLSRSDLPEPQSTGAGLMEVYCVQCHWMPTPQMHAAEEWDLLLRRMVLRAELLQKRVEGEHIPESFTASAQFRVVPTPRHLDSLRAYLKRNALPVTDPDELPETPEAELFVEECSVCHQTPSPRAHTASEWASVVGRMQANIRLMHLDTLSERRRTRILDFLRRHAADGG